VPFPASADMAVWLQKVEILFLSSEMFGEPLSSQKSTDLTSPHANEILLEFVLEVAKAEVSLEECQAWFERNIIKL
ncbi:MAG: hypothetical protein ACPG3Z_00590, partial [Saprospiraceae bacterium]